ncbi:MAG TPA: hypothetical protein VL463_16060 [Kofleriaceae bacterium]|nr:hypothetical protein [Kofleriaceae bacterium]
MAHRSNLISSLLIVCAIAGSARADGSKRSAQALVTQGIHLLEKKQYDDALDKFRAAYDAYPSPKILLDIGSTLRDMGRLADAANTYAQYLDETGADAKPEVKKLLRDLDKKLCVLVIDIAPAGADVAIDDGAWIPVAGRMQSRVEGGTHLVRARHPGLATQEITVDGHPGSHEDVTITLRATEAAPKPAPPVAVAPAPAPTPTPEPAWVNEQPPIVTQSAPRANRVPPMPPRVAVREPLLAPDEDRVVVVAPRREPVAPAGVQVASRIDGRLRGAAVALGIVVDAGPIETEISGIISHDAQDVVPGAYGGFRLHAGERVRPFLSAGVPVIWSGDAARVAIRGGGGLELFLDSHLALLVDLGAEHFFNPQPSYAATLFVPIVGLQGRL